MATVQATSTAPAQASLHSSRTLWPPLLIDPPRPALCALRRRGHPQAHRCTPALGVRRPSSFRRCHPSSQSPPKSPTKTNAAGLRAPETSVRRPPRRSALSPPLHPGTGQGTPVGPRWWRRARRRFRWLRAPAPTERRHPRVTEVPRVIQSVLHVCRNHGAVAPPWLGMSFLRPGT